LSRRVRRRAPGSTSNSTHPARCLRRSRRLDEQVFEAAFLQQQPVGNAVQRHTAREAQILAARLCLQPARDSEKGLISDSLERGRDIAEPVIQLFLFASARPEEPFQRRATLDSKLERAAIHLDIAGGVALHESPEGGIETIRIAVSCQSHDLPLAVVSKAEKPGDLGPEKAQRIRVPELSELVESIRLPAAQPGGGGLADPIHRENRRIFERRYKKCAGSVTEVVLDPAERSRTSCANSRLSRCGTWRRSR